MSISYFDAINFVIIFFFILKLIKEEEEGIYDQSFVDFYKNVMGILVIK